MEEKGNAVEGSRVRGRIDDWKAGSLLGILDNKARGEHYQDLMLQAEVSKHCTATSASSHGYDLQ